MIKYKKLPIEKKREIVEEVMLEKNIAEVTRKHGIPCESFQSRSITLVYILYLLDEEYIVVYT